MKLSEAQIARLESLETDGRRLTPAAVVEDAKKRTSPLHSLFPWDIKKAAYQHWLQTAREIIGSVTVVRSTSEMTIKVPKYNRDPDAKGQGYRQVDAMRRDPDVARESLIYTLETAAGHLRRAYDLAQGLGLERQIDALLAQVVGVQRSIKEAA